MQNSGAQAEYGSHIFGGGDEEVRGNIYTQTYTHTYLLTMFKNYGIYLRPDLTCLEKSKNLATMGSHSSAATSARSCAETGHTLFPGLSHFITCLEAGSICVDDPWLHI